MPTTKIVTLYSVTSPTNTILNIETIASPALNPSDSNPNPGNDNPPPNPGNDSPDPGNDNGEKNPPNIQSLSTYAPSVTGALGQLNNRRRINRSVGDWYLLIDWINKTFGDLIPPPPPPSRCLDLTILASCVTLLLNWIASHERITSSNGWSLFLQGDFNFQPPPLPPSRPRSFTSLIFSSKSTLAKEVDMKFDEANESALEWQSYLSAFGRINENIGLIQQNAAKSCKETGLKILALQQYLPTLIQRKTTKFFEADSIYQKKESAFRLSTLNDQIIMAIKGNQIVIVSI